MVILILASLSFTLGYVILIKRLFLMKKSKIFVGKLERFSKQVDRSEVDENGESQIYYKPVILYFDDEDQKYYAYNGFINPFQAKIGNQFELRVFKNNKRKAYLNKWYCIYFLPNFLFLMSFCLFLFYFLNKYKSY